MAMLGGLRKEEKVGLAVAALLHAGLVAVLLTKPPADTPVAPPERMTVNLTTEVGLEAAAPEPVAESRVAAAPELAEAPAPPVAQELPKPAPQPLASSKPAPVDTKRVDKPAATKPPPKTGGTRLGDNFLSGLGSSTTTKETRAPAAAIGASEKASLLQAIVREVKPRWQPPSGADADSLVSRVRFRLNPDGSLDGRPQLVGQSGVTDANRAQASRHGEQAVRAVQLAAPFALPPQYYAAWKSVTLTFDWKLSQ